MRLLVVAAIAVLLACGCSPQPSSPTVVASPTSTTGPTIISGGCGSTPIFKGGAPAWAHKLEGTYTYQEEVPHVLANPPTAIGFLYGYPLRAGHPENPSNKILWLVDLLPRTGSLDIIAHPLGAATPTVNAGAAFLPSGDVPSTIDMPQPGCWQFDLSWSGHHAELDVAYQ
jgi:hypothetical protein